METTNPVNQDVTTITLDDKPTFEKVWAMFQESREQMKASAREFDRRMKETDRKIKEIHDELGGIGKSNGEIAEDFFYSALVNMMKVKEMTFNCIDRNISRKRNKTEGEYDVILYNGGKILIVEIKYKFRFDYLRDFYEKIKIFKSLFPEYQHHRLYGAIAGMTFEKNVRIEAQKYGFYVFTQENKHLKVVNPDDFVPRQIR